MIGYKALSVDYSQGSGLTHYQYDMTMHGPILGGEGFRHHNF
jgi:hypothetical protein